MSERQRCRWYRRARLPFWNEREQRIRAFWRIVCAVGIVLVGTITFNVTVVRPLELPLSLRTLLGNGFAALVTLLVLVG